MLTSGAVLSIFRGDTIQNPVLQVTEIGSSSGDKERFRLLLSDGTHLITSMVTSSLNTLCKEGHITNNTIIRITEYLLHTQGPRKIVIILNVEVVQSSTHRIGNPQAVEQASTSSTSYVPPPASNHPPQRPTNSNQSAGSNQGAGRGGGGPTFVEKKPNPQNMNTNISKPAAMISQQPPPAFGRPPQKQEQNKVPPPAKAVPQNQAVPFAQANPARGSFAKGSGSNFSQRGGGLQKPTNNNNSNNMAPNKRAASPAASVDGQTIYPISSLNPYLLKWTIKCRVAFKSAIKNFSTQKGGEGRLFSVELVDSSGEINCTVFNDSIDCFFPILEVGNVYIITRGTVKKRNGPKYTSIANDFEMNLSQGAVVVPCNEDASDIPQSHYSFRPLAEISTINDGDVVDVIAIVAKVSEVVSVPSKKDPGANLVKRTIVLIDDTDCPMELTIWGESAEEWSQEGNPVVAIKNLKVTDFNGRSLTANRSSRWEFEPNINRTHQLHNFMTTLNMDEIQIASRGGNAGNYPYKTLRDAKMEASGTGKTVSFSLQATVLTISHTDQSALFYTSCPFPNCNKKVTLDEQTNMWICTKCNKSYPQFSARYVLFVKISDETLTDFVTIFNDAGTLLLGKEANDIRVMKENGDTELEYIFDCAIEKRYNFKIKAIEEPYQDELRVKFTVQSLEPINYLEECKSVLDKIQTLLSTTK